MKGSPGLFYDQRTKYTMLLMGVGKEMVVEKDCTKLSICKKTFN